MVEQLRFNEALAELAREMLEIIHALPPIEDNWSEAYVDARFAPEGGCILNKFRIKRLNGIIKSVETSSKMDLLLKELWELRLFCLTNSWYGLKIVVSPTGECQTNFNFDPDCIGDDHFFDE
jgi:hypothetical protein